MSKSAKTNNVTAAMYDTLVRPVITENLCCLPKPAK